MLAQIRAFSQSLPAKILLAILVIAFAIWGIQGAFSGMNSSDVARVGGRAITYAQMNRELNLALQRLQERNPGLTRADAIKNDLHMQVLNGLIEREAMFAYAQKLGITASDATITREIHAIFSQEQGGPGFSETAYNEFLRRIEYSHPQFVELTRDNLAVFQLMQSLTAGARAPRSYGELLLAFQSETRTISVAQVPVSQVGAIPAPTDAQLQTLYREMEPSFALPEFRNLTLVVASPAAFAARITVSDEAIRQAFEAQRERLSTPEKRSYIVITARDRAQAQQAAQRLARGEEPEAIAAALGLQALRYDNQTLAESADPTLGRAVFGLAKGAAPQVLAGSLTPFAAVRLIAVADAVPAQLEPMRETIRTEIAREQSRERMQEAMDQFEEAIGGGAGPEDAARAAGFEVRSIAAVTADGRTPDGQQAPPPFNDPRLLRDAFAADSGEDIDFMRLESDLEVFAHINDITPESTRPFAEVREGLVHEWTRRERTTRLEAIGQRIIDAVHNGTAFEAAAQAQRAQITARSEVATRENAERTIPAIFTARQGEVVMAVSGDGGLMMVAQVEAIKRDDPAEQRPIVERNRAGLQGGENGVTASLAEAIQSTALAEGKPREFQNLIQQRFGTGAEDDAEQ